jgi:hypothetical protein
MNFGECMGINQLIFLLFQNNFPGGSTSNPRYTVQFGQRLPQYLTPWTMAKWANTRRLLKYRNPSTIPKAIHCAVSSRAGDTSSRRLPTKNVFVRGMLRILFSWHWVLVSYLDRVQWLFILCTRRWYELKRGTSWVLMTIADKHFEFRCIQELPI